MKKFICMLTLFVFVISCKKEKLDTICVNGYIEWTGDPAADGTGWVLVENNESQASKFFILTNLPDSFQEPGILVNACVYQTDERVMCFCPVDTVRYKYAITSIKKR